MTQEEFDKLNPTQQAQIKQMMMQSQAMKSDYSQMQDPYAQSQGRNRDAEGPQGRPEPMPAAQGQGGQSIPGLNSLAKAAGKYAGAEKAAAAYPETPIMAPESLAVGGNNAPVAQVGERIINPREWDWLN